MKRVRSELEKKVIQFVAEMVCIPKQSIKLESQLMRDLGLDGDDALEFFKIFQEKFSIDLSKFFVSCHFGEEGAYFPLLSDLKIFFMGKRKFIPISVGDLIDGINAGALSTNDLENRYEI